MKRTIGFLVLAFLVGNMIAQSISQSNVPAVVLNTFQLNFPNATNVKWRLKEGNYNVEFKSNSKANKLTLDHRGEVVRHSQDLFVSEIPEKVLATIRSRVSYYDIHDADRWEENGEVTYQISFKVDGKNHLFRVNEKGKLLKFRKELKDSEVPKPIMNLIQSVYGPYDIDNAKYVEEPEKTIYMLRGEINDYDHDFTFDEHTTILEHSQDLRESEIPEPVMNTLNASYAGYEIRDADLIEENGNGVYVLRLRKSRENIQVTFSPQGKVLDTK
jgi:uncharacterized membrane protein YkoI